MNIDLIQDVNFFDNIDYSKISNNIIVSSLYKLETLSVNRFNKNYLNVIKFCQKISNTFNLSFILFIDYTIYENNKYLKELDKIKDKSMFIIKYDFPNIKKYSDSDIFGIFNKLIRLRFTDSTRACTPVSGFIISVKANDWHALAMEEMSQFVPKLGKHND